ncbi:MAG: SDR family NAD(P)-dependent oxidoreductase, partial [Gammaproteobacteria bacterium]
MTEQKIALITGCVGGIGTAICYELAQQNVRVFANYYPSEADQAKAWQKKKKKKGVNIDLVAADVASYTDCEKMVETVEAEAG